MINFNFTNKTPKEDLLNLYSDLRKYEPVYWSDHHRAWIISRYQDVINGLANHELYTYDTTDSIVIRDLTCMTNNPELLSDKDRQFFQIQLPPEYTIHRKKLLDIYHSAIAGDLESKINLNINKIFSNIENIGPVDLVKTVTNRIPLLTICDLMGYDHEMADDVFQITSSLMKRASIQERIDICKNAYKFIINNPPPLVSNCRDRDVAISFCMGMMLGGSSSLTGTFPNFLNNIYQYNNYFLDVIKNKKLSNNFIQETLRYSFIQTNLIRVASSDHILHNKNIKKGDIVAFLLGSANFDETKFGKHTKDFNIYRNYKKTNLVFGHGMYRCIGFQTAILQLNCFLNYMIDNYKNISIDSIQYREERNLTGSLIESIYGQYIK